MRRGEWEKILREDFEKKRERKQRKVEEKQRTKGKKSIEKKRKKNGGRTRVDIAGESLFLEGTSGAFFRKKTQKRRQDNKNRRERKEQT